MLGVITFTDVVKSNGTDLVWLILLAFFISRGVISTGLGRRVALVFLRLLGRRTVGLGYGMALTELLIAPAMPSITARAGGVMLPITQSIAEALGSRPDEETRHRAGAYLIQCAFQANIVTAAMFLTAMAGNPLVVKLAADQGVEISWIGWAVAAFVPGVACLAVIPLALLYLVPPQVTRTPDAVALAKRELATMGAVSTKEIIMALIFVGLIAMWVFGDAIGIDATQAAAHRRRRDARDRRADLEGRARGAGGLGHDGLDRHPHHAGGQAQRVRPGRVARRRIPASTCRATESARCTRSRSPCSSPAAWRRSRRRSRSPA